MDDTPETDPDNKLQSLTAAVSVPETAAGSQVTEGPPPGVQNLDHIIVQVNPWQQGKPAQKQWTGNGFAVWVDLASLAPPPFQISSYV